MEDMLFPPGLYRSVLGSYGSVGERKKGKVPNSFLLTERDSGKWRLSNYLKDECTLKSEL